MKHGNLVLSIPCHLLFVEQSSAALEAEAKAKQAAEREKMKFMIDQRKMLEEQLAKVSTHMMHILLQVM